MINFKQEELIDNLIKTIKNKYSEVELVNITESPEDEDRESELFDFACDITSDILVDYGYHMLLMPVSKKAA